MTTPDEYPNRQQGKFPYNTMTDGFMIVETIANWNLGVAGVNTHNRP